jgi:4-hydroxybenzoate polyprenyltransferase
VKQTFIRIVSAAQLTRLTIAFGAISDIWFVVLLTRAESGAAAGAMLGTGEPGLSTGMTLGMMLLAGAIVAMGLSAYGASLNDVLDARHDTVFSPDRPIPAGRIKIGQAVVVAVGALLLAILAASMFGYEALRITLVTATAILFYNAAGKYIPAIGIPVLGMIHAAHMFIPNHALSFTLPVWLVFTHTLAIGAAVHVLEGKRPRLTKRSASAIGLSWLFWSTIIIGLGIMREGGFRLAPLGGMAPILAIVGFLCIVRWKTTNVPSVVAAEKLKRYGAMWQSLYGAAWLIAIGHVREAIWLSAFAVAGFLAMTLIKELTGLQSRPVSYRA